MINRTKPTLNLPFASMGQENANDAFQNVGGVVTNSNGTIVNEKGLIETVPDNQLRVDYDPVMGECKGLLIEEERMNLEPYSETGGGWSAFGTTPPSVNNNTVQDGLPCKSVTFPSGVAGYSGSRVQGSTFTVTSGTTYSFSYKVKFSRELTGSESIKIYLTGQAGFASIIISSNWSQQPLQWTKLSITDAPGLTGSDYVTILPNSNLSSPLTVYITQIQVEVGDFPTSYIPTAGTAVTRTADSISIEGQDFLDFYNQSEGTLVIDCLLSNSISTGNDHLYNIYDGSSNNRITAWKTVNQDYIINVRSNGAVIMSESIGSFSANTVFKHSVAYSLSSTITVNNGAISLTGGGVNNQFNKLEIGNYNNNGGYLDGHINSLIYYPVALPDTQMIQQTRND